MGIRLRRARVFGVLAGLAMLAGLQAGPAAAVTTVQGDGTADAYVSSAPIRALTWNICGEAGGSTPISDAYCPYRNDPTDKMQAVATAVQQQNANVVMLQEVCSGPKVSSNSGTAPSQLDMLATDLGSGWSFTWAEVIRPDGTSYCRAGLDGTLSVAIGVKGAITWQDHVAMPVNLSDNEDRGQVLCAAVAGWESRVCTAHVSNYDPAKVPNQPTIYANEVATVQKEISSFRSVVLGGDFNTQVQNNLQPLYSTMAECDQQPYYPGDTANATTEYSYHPTFDPTTGAISSGYYDSTKIDYLFSTSGFSSCDALTNLADQADYRASVQPGCNTAQHQCTPNGYSDHAPLTGAVKAQPTVDWGLQSAPSGATVSAGGYGFTGDHGGAVNLDGASGAITAAGPAVDTTRSFTVSAWAQATGAATSVIASQDSTNTSGFLLWYNQPDSTWRFAMPKSSAAGWSVDQTSAPAAANTWTHLTGVYDAQAQTVTLYVNGQKTGSTGHTTPWSATGPFVVGRDMINGHPNAFFNGSLQRVKVFGYPMTDGEVSSLAGGLTSPTAAATPGAVDPGCYNFPQDFPVLSGQSQPQHTGYGTASSLTPTLTVSVLHPDASRSVHADFGIWDDTDSTQPQPIAMGGPGSASADVLGGGTVSVTVPTLIPNHLYGWYARTDDGSGTSANGPVCHFYAPQG